jgi:HSP20 family molecular chaperone IbpA
LLPEVKKEDVRIDIHDGVLLNVRLPKATTAKSKAIEIKVS